MGWQGLQFSFGARDVRSWRQISSYFTKQW